jgi:hypothetical protein
MMIRLIRRSSCQCEFANRRETAVLRSDRGFAIPERQEFQYLQTPITLSFRPVTSGERDTRIDEVLEPADNA